MQHIHLNMSASRSLVTHWKRSRDAVVCHGWCGPHLCPALSAVKASTCRRPPLAHCGSRQLCSLCTDWLVQPGAGAVFVFVLGKSPLSSTKACDKVQRMLVSSWCGAASSCGCSNRAKEGNHHFDLVLSMFWSCLGCVP